MRAASLEVIKQAVELLVPGFARRFHLCSFVEGLGVSVDCFLQVSLLAV